LLNQMFDIIMFLTKVTHIEMSAVDLHSYQAVK
jgi:hypothetical protein